MRVKRICPFLFLSLLTVNCAKKGAPTSPDRTPPFLSSVEVVDRGHIEITFDEDIEIPAAESLSNIMVDGLQILASVASKKKIFLTTDDMDTVEYKIKLFNISDLSGNGKDEYKSKFRGTLRADTMPPAIVRSPSQIVRNTPPDTNLTIKFTEQIESSHIYIMPETKVSYNWNGVKTEVEIKISAIDTLTVYHIYGVFWDGAGNSRKVDISLSREKNLPLIWLKGTTEDSTVLLMTKNGGFAQFTLSDSTGNFIFQNLYPGEYTLFGKSKKAYLSSGALTLSLPKEAVELYTIDEEKMDVKLLQTLNSFYTVYLGDSR